MGRTLTFVSLLALQCLPVLNAQSTLISDPASYVLPFIGTQNGGHVFPGATLPHGMAKPGLDTDSPNGQAGYDGNPIYHATGFSSMHDSGTGGGDSLSNFKLWPLASCPSFNACPTDLTARKVLRNVLPDGSADDSASPGYFATNLSTGIRVELTSTRRTGIHRYTFPPSTTQPRILVDITNDGQDSAQNQTVLIDPDTGRITGGANFAPSFGTGRYNAFTCVDFQGVGYALGKPTEYGVYLGNTPTEGTTSPPSGASGELGALLTFTPDPTGVTSILARVGVSLISVDQACANAESEIPSFDFDGVHQASRAQWNELLGRVQVNVAGVPRDTVELFYSSLYRTHISPQDYTDENPKWTSSEPYYDSYYCNIEGDTFRNLYSLMSLHDPVTFSLITRALIDVQRNEGWLPECRGSTDWQWIQGGSNADPILGEFFVKYHDHAQALNVSSDDLYTALVADAENQAPSWLWQGRQANVYNQYGYLPWDIVEDGELNTRQVSRTLEYAFDDFAISQVARILGKNDDATKYAQRAGNFINVWNPNTTVPDNTTIVGMMQPRFQNGTFGYTDPRHCSVHDPTQSTCFLVASATDGFYEGSPLIYSQFVPQDTAKLIQLQGGNDKFVQRLDFMFAESYYDASDEPSMQMPFMYHYTGRSGLSTQRSRQVISQFYNTSTSGLPGNDDSGAMGAYVTFFLAGLYPIPATRQYLLSSPYFSEISFYNPLYKTTTRIIANGFSGNPADGTGGKVFVKKVTVNGQQYKSNCYLEWDVFEAGSTIELELTDDINVTCGDGPDAIPPSLSTGGFD